MTTPNTAPEIRDAGNGLAAAPGYLINKETYKILGWVMLCLNEGKEEGARQCIHSGLFKAFYAGRECEHKNRNLAFMLPFPAESMGDVAVDASVTRSAGSISDNPAICRVEEAKE